jgi:hypothetical protein
MEEEKKPKGRPSRTDQIDPQSTSCIIRDPQMEPFYVVKDASNFTVIEKSTATRGFGGKKATGKEQENVIGYYSSFSNALNRIAKEKFYKNKGEYSSIKEYITTWNEVKNGLDNLLKSIEI